MQDSRCERVRDREDDDTHVVVLEATGKAAEQSYISALGQTVAEANPDYPADDPVLSVAFVEIIEDALGIDWEPGDIVEIAERGELTRARIKTYAYPESRLAPAEEQSVN